MPDTPPRTPGLEDMTIRRVGSGYVLRIGYGAIPEVLTADALLAELRVRLTPAPQGEPVAWMLQHRASNGQWVKLALLNGPNERASTPNRRVVPLYAGAAPASTDGVDCMISRAANVNAERAK